MKKASWAIGLSVITLALALAAPTAFAAASDWHLSMRNGDDTGDIIHELAQPLNGVTNMLVYDSSIGFPVWYAPDIFKSNVLDQYGYATAAALSTATSTLSAIEASDVITLQYQVNAINTTLTGTTTQANWNTTATTSPNYIQNKPTIGKAYDGTTARSNTFPVFGQATVASGNLVFNLTDDGTSSGNAVCPTGPITNSLQTQPEEGSSPHAFGTPVWSNSNKTVTIPVTKLGTVLGILALNQSANGSLVRWNVWCY